MNNFQPVPLGYELLYKINESGDVVGLNYACQGIEGKLNPWQNHKGYLMVTLSKNGERRNHRVNRLVALTFIPNPHNHPCVLHGRPNDPNDPMTNHVSNLRWGTHKENYDQSVAEGRRVLKPKKIIRPQGPWEIDDPRRKSISTFFSKPVNCYTPDGILVTTYASVTEASKSVGRAITSICNCIAGRKQTSGGFIWKYIENK